MESEKSICWKKIRVVIFDVDGTLYDQSKLRKKMLFSLLTYYAIRPWKLKEMLILQHFRMEREKKAGSFFKDLENEQYNWCAVKGKYPIEKVREVVDRWIFRFPNQYLADCLYPDTQSFFDALRKEGKTVAIYSDYKAHDKMKAMGLEADLIVSSTDPDINCLKPEPKGLLSISEKLKVSTDECLFIGDRQEMDGECAIRANMPYLIIEKQPQSNFTFYTKLKSEFLLSFDSTNYESNHYSSQS